MPSTQNFTLFIFISLVIERYRISLSGCIRWKNLHSEFECYLWFRSFNGLSPLNFLTELIVTSLDPLCSCFLWYLKCFRLSVSKSRAILGIDSGFPFLLHISLSYNHFQFWGFSSHLGDDFQKQSFCTFMYSPNQLGHKSPPGMHPSPWTTWGLWGMSRDAWIGVMEGGEL